MKKGIFGKLGKGVAERAAFAALMAGAAVFFGCAQNTVESPGQAGTGTVTLNIGFVEKNTLSSQLGILRTVHPDIEAMKSIISRYVVTFKESGGTDTGPVELNAENPRPITLVVGTYKAELTAFGKDGTTAIAEGTGEGIQVVKGQDVTVGIILGPKPDAGSGTLSYKITVPGTADSAKISITPISGDDIVDDIILTAGDDNEGAKTLTSGIYTVVVSLKKGNDCAGFSEIVYIYKDLTVSLPEKSYTEGDFTWEKNVSLLDLTENFTAPAAGLPPVKAITTSQYSGSIAWKEGDVDFTGPEFGKNKVYTAVITLMPAGGYNFIGVAANTFRYNTITGTNDAGGNVVTISFPATGDKLSGLGSVNLFFPSKNIAITSNADGTNPENITFSVPGEYADVGWYVDGNPVSGTANSIEIDPDHYSVKPHTLSVIGRKNGKQYSGNAEFAVWYTGVREVFALTALDDLPEYLASLPENTVEEPHLVSLASFSVSDTGKWEALKTAIDTLKNGDVYINLDLRACTADNNTITGGKNATDAKANNVFNYMTYASNGTERTVGLMLPYTLTAIGENALYSSKSLRSITIPSGVTTIGGTAFKDCLSLTSITIPASVQSIGGSAFTGCAAITRVILEGVPETLSGSNPLPRDLNKTLNGPGTYEYNTESGTWSKVD